MAIGEISGSGTDFLLDTGVVIRHLRNDIRAHRLLDRLEKLGTVSTSVITVMEVTVGQRSAEEEEACNIFFQRYPPIDVNMAIARKAANLIRGYPHLFGREVTRGIADALIAATAIESRCTLVTLNTRHFAQVPVSGLAVSAIDQESPSWI